VSPRIPGSPCVGPTSPEMRRLTLKYAETMRDLGIGSVESVLDLTMIELKYAMKYGRLSEVVT